MSVPQRHDNVLVHAHFFFIKYRGKLAISFKNINFLLRSGFGQGSNALNNIKMIFHVSVKYFVFMPNLIYCDSGEFLVETRHNAIVVCDILNYI